MSTPSTTPAVLPVRLVYAVESCSRQTTPWLVRGAAPGGLFGLYSAAVPSLAGCGQGLGQQLWQDFVRTVSCPGCSATSRFSSESQFYKASTFTVGRTKGRCRREGHSRPCVRRVRGQGRGQSSPALTFPAGALASLPCVRRLSLRSTVTSLVTAPRYGRLAHLGLDELQEPTPVWTCWAAELPVSRPRVGARAGWPLWVTGLCHCEWCSHTSPSWEGPLSPPPPNLHP